MGVYLPEELLLPVLYWLPPKSLLRFRSVCKSWYSLIISPRFIESHRLTNSLKKQVILHGISPNKYYIHRDDESFDKLFEVDSPLGPLYDFTLNFDHQNGLICLFVAQFAYKPERVVYLWNPSIRRLFLVPEIPVMDVDSWDSSKWGVKGFGFVPETNDYKIINIYGCRQQIAWVYELNTGFWKKINNSLKFFYEYEIKRPAPQCCLNNMIHWLGYKHDNNIPRVQEYPVIVTLNLKNDELGVLTLPSYISDIRTSSVHVDLCLTLFQDSLAVVDHHIVGCYNIWVMYEYGVSDSWMKHVKIDLTVFKFDLLRILHNGEALFRKRTMVRDHDLVSYNPQNGKMKNLVLNAPYIIDAYHFVPSLVLLDKPAATITRN